MPIFALACAASSLACAAKSAVLLLPTASAVPVAPGAAGSSSGSQSELRLPQVVRSGAPAPGTELAESNAPESKVASPVPCVDADWKPQALASLLKVGKGPASNRQDHSGSAGLLFDSACTDSPAGVGTMAAAPVVIDGVEVRLVSATKAGTSGRGWVGNQCSFALRSVADSGATVYLGPSDVPPFNTVTALVRSGSAVWVSIGFNGYAREFPKGGNRILAADLCEGRVVWRSKDATSNGGLLLVDGYLVSPYGFTSEPRSVFVFDAHTGQQIQKLPVVETICPSKSWAPNWHQGERCDSPGQRVGAATNPRLEGGALLIDTNTGSAAFALD